LETVSLGLHSDMTAEQTRRQLNKEYGKWNARVTNSDSDVQTRACSMLKLIAAARSRLVG